MDDISLPGYMEIVRYGGEEADLQVHLLVDGEEVGGSLRIEYCPFCGRKVIECSCQPLHYKEMKQEVKERKKLAAGKVCSAEEHD